MADKTPSIEKLCKLIAMEKSARTIGSLEEAKAFASKIQELLNEHKLGMDEVEYADREANEPVDWTRVSVAEVGFRETKCKQLWQDLLARAIAECNGCAHVIDIRYANRFLFVGRTTDRELCRLLFLYLLELAREMAEKAAEQDKSEQQMKCMGDYIARAGDDIAPTNEKGEPMTFNVVFNNWMRDYRRSWYLGFAKEVISRLYAKKAEMEAKGNGTTAMVHIEKDKLAVKSFLDDNTKQRKAATGESGMNGDGFKRGQRAGKAVALTPHTFKHHAGKVAGLLGN